MKRSRVNPRSTLRLVQNTTRARLLEEAFGPQTDWLCKFPAFLGHAMLEGVDTSSWKLMGCYGPVHGHEILKRSRGGSITDMQNVVLLCNFHNGWIEDFPKEAHAMGLSKHAWEVSDTTQEEKE